MLTKRYSLCDRQWYPELKQNVPNVPIVLVGLKIDMR